MRRRREPQLHHAGRRLLVRLAALLPLCLLTACKPQLPAGVISEAKMEKVLYDYHMAQGMAEAMPPTEDRSMDMMRYEFHQAVFRKYGITEAEFDSSMVFYCSDIERLSRIYRHVQERLTRDAEALGVAAGPRDIYAGLTATGDTANVWMEQPLYVLRPQPLDNFQTWQIPCDSTWLHGDDIMWRFMLLRMERSEVAHSFADLIVVYTNDSVRSALKNLGGRSMTELRVDNPLGWVPKTVTGHLYTALQTDGQKTHYLFFTDIALIRFHKSKAARDRWAKGDSIAADSLLLDSTGIRKPSLGEQEDTASQHRRSPEEFMMEMEAQPDISIVKGKDYQQTNKRRRTFQRKKR